MKKIFTSIWISIACVGVMILTGSLIVAFYITVAFRKLFIKDFTPNALKGTLSDEEDVIESARSHINAVQANLEKPNA